MNTDFHNYFTLTLSLRGAVVLAVIDTKDSFLGRIWKINLGLDIGRS